MPVQGRHQTGAGSQARFGRDVRALFGPGVFTHEGSVVPRQWHPLPDFRLSVPEEGLDLLQGRTPAKTGLGSFDPLLGPFSLPSAQGHGWAMSFEFLRDLSPSSGDLVAILEVWLDQWFICQAQEVQSGLAKWKAFSAGPARSDVLLWRGRRVIHWMAYLLPLVASFSANLQARIWHGLLADIARLIEPDRGFLANLAGGREPLSRRAVWTRAFALLAVSGSAPGLLRQATIGDALDRMEELIAPDGLFVDGSPLGTLSAAADLAMLTRLVETEPVNQRVRQALATLRREDGSLVTFDKQRGYAGLVGSVLGPGRWKRSSILKTGHIGLIEAGSSRLWMKTPAGPSQTGPICEIEAHGFELFSCSPSGLTALMLDRSVAMSNPQIRRRDEDGQALLEGTASFEVDGQRHSCVRTVTMRHTGGHIHGEDALFSGPNGARVQVVGLLFDLGAGCSPVVSRDGESLLIRTPSRQTWRLRCPGLDLDVKEVKDHSSCGSSQNQRYQVYSKPNRNSGRMDHVMRWNLTLEGLN